MKSIFLISTAVLVLTVAHGQTFAPIGAKWYYSAQASGMAPPNSEYYLYESQLDTVVAGQSCQKISVTYYKYFNGDTAYLPPVFTYQSTDTVYYYNTIYSKYFPLYIFNVLQGDTLVFHSPVIPFPTSDTLWRAVVDSVTSLIISSDTLQRVWTTPLDNYAFHGSYIEKLGCDFLMLHQNLGLIIEHDGPMRCYSDSIISYNFNTFPCDYRLTTGINEIENYSRLSISPNPFSAQTVLQTDNLLKNATLSIVNCFGQTVSHIKNISVQTIVFSRDNLASGLYFVRLTEENKTIAVDKLVIADK